MNRSLYSQDLSKSLKNFVREMHRLDLADNPQLVFQLAIKWTGGQSLLTKKLLKYILESKTKIRYGQEAARLEKVIRQRLLKEFKHDDLTLSIRKIIYVKDLARISIKSQGKIGDREQIYLTKIQQQLGLSPQQGKNIQAQYLKSKLTVEKQKGKQQNTDVETHSQTNISDNDAFQELISLIEKSPIYDELLAQNTVSNHSLQKTPKLTGLLRSKYFWLCLATPFLLLIARTFFPLNVNQSDRVVTAADDTQPNSYCSSQIESLQMSLGEKLLTPYEQLPSAAKIAVYEASAAFSKCQYTIAQTNFQQALEIEPNNPEAFIYLNNTQAIAKNNIDENFKIAVSVPLQNQPAVAKEILRGVAQAQLEINQQGGIDSKLLVIQIINDRQDRLMAEIERELAADRTVLATIGYGNFNTSLTADNVYQQEGSSMIYAIQADLSKKKILAIEPNITDLANTLANYATASSFKKIAICADSGDVNSSLFAREFTAKITADGIETTTIPCDFAREYFNPVPIVNQALAQSADAILLSPADDSIERAISVAQIDRNRLALLGNHNFHTKRTIDAGQAVSQLILPTPWLPDTVAARKFAKDARSLWNTEANWRSAMLYDAIYAVADSLKQTQNPSELQSILSKNINNKATAKSTRLAYIAKPSEDSQRYQFLPLDKKP